MKVNKKVIASLASAAVLVAAGGIYINNDERKIAKMTEEVVGLEAKKESNESNKMVKSYEKDFLKLKIEEIQATGLFIDSINEEREGLIKKFIEQRVNGEIKDDIEVVQKVKFENYTEILIKNTVKIIYKLTDGEGNKEIQEQDYHYFTGPNNTVLKASDFIMQEHLEAVKNSFIKKAKAGGIDLPESELLSNLAYIDKKEFTLVVGKEYISLPMKEIKGSMKDGYFQKQIALTFDDGPSKITSDILDVLRKYDAKATFFVLGSLVEKNPEILKEVYEEGHQIGLHSWKHDNYKTLSLGQMQKDLEDSIQAVSNVVGEKVKVFRPPYGAYNEKVVEVLKENEIENILWSVDTLDWKNRDANKITNHFVNHAGDGDIVLMHDLYDSTKEGLEKSLKAVKNEGYTFVTLDELY